MTAALKAMGLVTATACWVMPLAAETFWWKPSATVDVEYSDFGNPENWGISSATGDNPDSRVPGASDDVAGSRAGNWNLCGRTWTVRNWNALSDWTQHKICLSNGTLAVTGECRTRRGYWIMRKGAALFFPESSHFIPSEGDGKEHFIHVGPGTLFDFRGKMESYKLYLTTTAGGVTVFDPKEFSLASNTKQDNILYTEGTMVFPHGLKWTMGGGDAEASKFRFVLFPSGRVVAAGDFSRQGHTGKFHFDLRGGVFEAMDTVTFSDVDVKAVRAGMDFVVHGNALLDLSGFAFDAETPCRKFSSGTLRLGESRPSSLLVAGGKVSLSCAFDGLAGFSFLNKGIAVRIEKAGSRLDKLDFPEQTANISFECGLDLSETSAETVVFSSADATILSKAKEAFRAVCPAGNAIVAKDGALVLVNSGMVMSIR